MRLGVSLLLLLKEDSISFRRDGGMMSLSVRMGRVYHVLSQIHAISVVCDVENALKLKRLFSQVFFTYLIKRGFANR